MLHISGTIHHMIVIHGTHMENDNISRHFFFFFFKILGTLGGRGKKAKNGLKLQNILSVSLRISGTVHHDYSFWHMCVK